MAKYETRVDGYKKVNRLDLYQFDGTPIQPMYQAYNPPMMLPTVTMNPTSTAGAPKETAKGQRRRSDEPSESLIEPLNKDAKHIKRHVPLSVEVRRAPDMANSLWWVGVGMTVVGGAAYLL